MAPTVTTVSLLRHGEVRAEHRETNYGQRDVPLSVQGQAQSRALSELISLQDPTPTRVFSSDAIRCRSLAVMIVQRTPAELELDTRLREQAMGRWEGQRWSELRTREQARVEAFWARYSETRPPGGEALTDVSARSRGFWHQMLAGLASGSPATHHHVVVVTHAGVIRALVGQALGIAPTNWLRLAPPLASLTRLSVAQEGAVLEQFGYCPS